MLQDEYGIIQFIDYCLVLLTFSSNYMYFVKYCDCTSQESCISLILCIIKLFLGLI